MITQCRVYLIEKLTDAMGAGTKICTTLKELKAYTDSHVGAVIIDTESIVRNGSKVNVMTEEGRSKRTLLYTREARFLVTLGEYTIEAAEPMFENFMLSLDKGIALPNGDYVSIEPGELEWIAKDDSVLKSEISAVLTIVCKGGMYKNINHIKINEAQITVEEEK